MKQVEIREEADESDARREAPLSYGQQRLWFFDRLQSRSSLYNMQHVMTWRNALDIEALRRALQEMVRRHEVLRTTFVQKDGRPVQVVHPAEMPPFSFVDLADHSEEQRDRILRRLFNDELQQGFDLERGPILNFVLVRLEPDHYVLSVCIHHIAFDDWSVLIFERELMVCYEDAKRGRAFSLEPVPLQYADFGTAQRARFSRQSLDPQLTYWRDRLQDLPAGFGLPTDHPRPAAQTFPGAIRTFAIPPRVAHAFRQLTRNADATPFMSLFAAFAVLLHRYSGELDLVVGTPVANRNRPELAGMVGFFVNTLVLRVDLRDDPSFVELLPRARDMTLGALANQDVPFELLVEELRPDREANRQPLFQTMFVFQSGHAGKEGGKDLPSSGAKFDLTFTAVEGGSSICGELEYNTDLFERDTMERMANHFETLISSIVAEPYRPISELALLGSPERQRMVTSWNATATTQPSLCVNQIIDEIAATRADAPAVVFDRETLSYGQIARRSAALARRLSDNGIAQGSRVGLCLDRKPDWIIGMLAVLKAGGTMVPLDPALPGDRLAFMIGDADVQLVLTQTAYADKLAGSAARLLQLDAEPAAEAEPLDVLDRSNLNGLAYIIYTSGSTGRPKGVLIKHLGLSNLALAQGNYWSVGPDARVLQFASIGFDAAMSEVFSTLCLGGVLHLAAKDDLMPGVSLLRTLRDRRITHVTLPPSALAAMQPEGLPDLRVVISAGEACERDLARRWVQGRRFVNAYGPTETTVCATMGDYDPKANAVAIGKPIANTQVYVLDRHGEPVPAGVTGEIFVGGIGVAAGYLNRPDLTAERFVRDHFLHRHDAQLYATGDLGRFAADGVLHHLGRRDSQLKIRGFRIEPGEIETALRNHPRVEDALVIGHGKGPDARLIAYLIPSDPPPLVVELRAFLSGQLPEYMLPAAYLTVPSWPKTPNGKIDRVALPRPDALSRDLDTTFVAPGDDLESTIAAIWCDCLGVDEVGANDNFFDLGGHSLLLVRVLEQMKEKLKIEMPLTDLFRYPTVRKQAQMIAARKADKADTDALGFADERAARQNAVRMQRRRNAVDRHA